MLNAGKELFMKDHDMDDSDIRMLDDGLLTTHCNLNIKNF